MRSTSTPYDDVFRTLLNDCKQLVIPLINEMFGENYPWNENILTLQNEHFIRRQEGYTEERITDSCILLGKKKYHIECQSTPDGSMTVRMFEYDTQIALESSNLNNHVLEMHFPESAVLYLRSTESTPDKLTVTLCTPGGKLTYHIPVMKMKDYNLDNIFDKRLYFLIPFYLFTFEHDFAKMESDKVQLNMLKREYSVLAERLETLADAGVISELVKTSIVELTEKVTEHLADKYSSVKKGVNDIMGGKILDYKAKDIFKEGLQQGWQNGSQARGMLCYLNAIGRSMSHEDAIAIAEITEEEAAEAIILRKEGKL